MIAQRMIQPFSHLSSRQTSRRGFLGACGAAAAALAPVGVVAGSPLRHYRVPVLMHCWDRLPTSSERLDFSANSIPDRGNAVGIVVAEEKWQHSAAPLTPWFRLHPLAQEVSRWIHISPTSASADRGAQAAAQALKQALGQGADRVHIAPFEFSVTDGSAPTVDFHLQSDALLRQIAAAGCLDCVAVSFVDRAGRMQRVQ